jgi:hypothetical protein
MAHVEQQGTYIHIYICFGALLLSNLRFYFLSISPIHRYTHPKIAHTNSEPTLDSPGCATQHICTYVLSTYIVLRIRAT